MKNPKYEEGVGERKDEKKNTFREKRKWSCIVCCVFSSSSSRTEKMEKQPADREAFQETIYQLEKFQKVAGLAVEISLLEEVLGAFQTEDKADLVALRNTIHQLETTQEAGQLSWNFGGEENIGMNPFLLPAS